MAAELTCNAALLGSFLVCFLLAKATRSAGLGNSYNQTGWLTAEQWRFLPFALVCDALFAVLAFWVFPVLLPLCGLHLPAQGQRCPPHPAAALFAAVPWHRRGGHCVVHHGARGF